MAAATSSSIAAHRLFSTKTLPLNPKTPSTHLPRSVRTALPIPIRSKKPSSITPIRVSPDPDPAQYAPSLAAGSLKRRLAAGEALYGLFLLSASPTLAEIAGLAGYDFVVVDLEHGPAGAAEALPCLRALAAARTPAVIRLPELSPVWAKKALDLGPQGLMFPMVDSAELAELAVASCRFPPRGVRGSAHPVVRASAYGLDDAYLSRCEEELLVMCQVESAAAVENIEAIAGVEGVDVIQMGPLDLSASMGYLWDPGNRRVREAVREAERRVFAARKSRAAAEGGELGPPWLGGFSLPHDGSEALKLRGYHMVGGAVDVGMFRQAAVEDVRRWREAKAEIGEELGDDEDDGGEKPGDDSYWSE